MLLSAQVPIMEWLQVLFSWGQSFFEILFIIITFLGEELFLYVLIPAIYWCYNKELGELLALTGFASLTVNGALKDIFKIDRPFIHHSDKLNYVEVDNFFVNTTELSSSYSFPSGHSQEIGAVSFTLAAYFKKKKFWIIAAIVTLLVMYSRVFLGVHWPLDVLVGGLLGLGIGVLGHYLFTKFPKKRILIYFAMVLVSFLALIFANKPDTYKAIGAMMGFACGALVEHRYVNFEIKNISTVKKVLRIVVGLVLLLGLKVGLKPLFLLISDHVIFDLLRYFILVFIAIAIYPWIFKKLKF